MQQSESGGVLHPSTPTEFSLREHIKCVIVGDSGVGKSKLVYALCYHRTFNASELWRSYIPTIFAVDQYKYKKHVQEACSFTVDGVETTIQVWDTFGDHNRDRCFSYQHADVVILCFSLTDEKSARNLGPIWLKEIRKNLKNVPVILVGTQLDMRWMDLHKYNVARSRFAKPLTPHDIISPDKARDIVEELCLPYYETSVLNGFGVQEVFENAIRAALLFRRSNKFYGSAIYRRVQEPQLAAPCLPPEREVVLPTSTDSTWFEDLASLVNTSGDLVLRFSTYEVSCHSLFLLLSSTLISSLFSSSALCGNHCGLESASDSETEHRTDEKTDVVYLSDENVISVQANIRQSTMETCLHFIYTHTLPEKELSKVQLDAFHEAASQLQLSDFQTAIKAYTAEESSDRVNLRSILAAKWRVKLMKAFDNAQQYSRLGFSDYIPNDISFILKDGVLHAHKCLLVARSQYMSSMLGGRFKESATRSIQFSEISMSLMRVILTYLYTDSLGDELLSNGKDTLACIELANRMCLTHCLSLIECDIVEELMHDTQATAIKECLVLVERSKFYNAHQLHRWSLAFLCNHYDELCHQFSYLRDTILSKECKQYLEQNRWPPVYYIKDYDHYQKRLNVLRSIERNKRHVRAGHLRWWLWPKTHFLATSNYSHSPHLKQSTFE